MCEDAKASNESITIVIATVNDGKVSFAAGCGKQAVKLGAHAGKIVKAAAQIAGGNGGGKPDIAMAGGKNADKIDDALAAVKDTVSGMLKA